MNLADQSELKRRIEAAEHRRDNCDDPAYQRTQDQTIEDLSGRLALAKISGEAEVILEVPNAKKRKKKSNLAIDVQG